MFKSTSIRRALVRRQPTWPPHRAVTSVLSHIFFYTWWKGHENPFIFWKHIMLASWSQHPYDLTNLTTLTAPSTLSTWPTPTTPATLFPQQRFHIQQNHLTHYNWSDCQPQIESKYFLQLEPVLALTPLHCGWGCAFTGNNLEQITSGSGHKCMLYCIAVGYNLPFQISCWTEWLLTFWTNLHLCCLALTPLEALV